MTASGIYRSDDVGESWTRVSSNLKADRAKTLVASPNSSGHLVAVGCGEFESVDFGITWTSNERGLPTDCSLVSAGFDPHQPFNLFVGGPSGFLRSEFDSSGEFWTPVASGLFVAPAVLAFSSFSGGLALPGRMFVAPETGGFFVSDDRGETWAARAGPSGASIFALTAFDADSWRGNNFVIVFTDQGLFETQDAGESWERTDVPLVGVVHALLTADSLKPASYAATGLGVERDIGAGWAPFSEGLPDGLPILHVFADPRGRRLFASTVSEDQTFAFRYSNPTISAEQRENTVFVGQGLSLPFTISPPQPADVSIEVTSSDPDTVMSPPNAYPTPFGNSGGTSVTGLRATGQPVTIRAHVSDELGGSETSWTVTVVNPPPKIWRTYPSVVQAGSPGFTLEVSDGGSGTFVQGATIYWNSSPLSTTVVPPGPCAMFCPTSLEAPVPAEDLAVAGLTIVTVVNPPPGGGVSNPLIFKVDATNLRPNPARCCERRSPRIVSPRKSPNP